MTMSDLNKQTFLSNPDQQPSKPHKSPQKYPMNKQCQTCGKMDIINEEMEDEEMEDQGTITSSTTPTRASARLAAKLKQIMGMNTTQVPMSIETDADDMDTEDPKKRARAPTLLPGLQAINAKHT